MSARADDGVARCDHARRSPLWGGLLARCEACGLVATATAPNLDYGADYFVAGGPGYDFDSELARAFDAARFAVELDGLAGRGLRGSLLDVGCAVGTFLVHAKTRGFEPAGVEVAEEGRRRASERVGVPIAASLAALPAGRSYDVVTLHHVLEHVDHPLSFLRDELAPRVGRHLLVEVPNFASLAARSEGPAWRDLRPDQHVHHFEPATLSRLVEAAGFELLAVTSLADPLWSLHAARRTVRSLRALGGPRAFAPESAASARAAAADSVLAADWRPPTGTKAFVIEASRLALRPLQRWIERTLRAERLVVEARPRQRRG